MLHIIELNASQQFSAYIIYLLSIISGKGPNVLAVGNSNDEKLYFGVDSPTTASAGE